MSTDTTNTIYPDAAPGIQTINFKIVGIAPMLQHNGQLADPQNPHAQALAAISGKRKKTDEGRARIADIEWLGSIYANADGRVIVPGEVVEAALVEAAKTQRLGKIAKAGMFVEDDSPLNYTGPKDISKLQADARFRLTKCVRVQQSRVPRTRPMFRDWSAEIKVSYNPELIDRAQVAELMAIAGERIGIGDWRPRYGRFLVESAE